VIREDLLTLRLLINTSQDRKEVAALALRLAGECGAVSRLVSLLIVGGLTRVSRLLLEGRDEEARRLVQLVHNLPLSGEENATWDRDHFYHVELASYLDHEPDVQLIEFVLSQLGRGLPTFEPLVGQESASS
jgi:hypothetical protein